MKGFRAFVDICKKLYFILSEKQRIGAVVVFCAMITMSLLELMGVSAIYPFLQAVLNPSLIREKWYIRWIYMFTSSISDRNLVLLTGIAIIFIFLFKNAMALLLAYVEYSYATSFQRDQSVMMLDNYMKRPYEFFVNTNSTIVLRGISSDTQDTYSVLVSLMQLIGECMTVVVLGIYLIRTDWFIAICVLTLVGICLSIIVTVFKKRIKIAGRERRYYVSKSNQYLYQAVNGIKEITVLNRRKRFVEAYEKAAEKMAKTTLLYNIVSASPDRILEGVCVGGAIAIVCLRICIGADMTEFVPIIGTFAMGAFKLLPAVSKISGRINNIIYNSPGLYGCYEDLQEVRVYGEQNNKQSTIRENQDSLCFKNTIYVNNVSWKYLNSADDVLNNVSLRINKGESVAFIGASGAGKTTLADVIMGLYVPQEGDVTVDGISVFESPEQWHKIIGYVPQSVYLIDDTIRANIAFGLPKDIVDDEKVWSALIQAQMRDFVEQLPEGLDTIVGERGIKFSGGQRQRVAIARALYENPDILVLDEATSALDTETETAVMQSIENLQGSKTLIIIAHRFTTIRKCDRIYEVADGKVVERRREEIFNE